MGALAYRHYPLASGVFNLTHLNENLADISDVLSNLDNDNIAAGANIAVSKLAASNVEICLTVSYRFDVVGTSWSGQGASATVPWDLCPIPGINGDTSWVVDCYQYVCNDVGTVDGAFGLYVGHYDGAGAWSNDHTIVASQTISSPVDNLGSNGTSARLASPTVTLTANAKSLALMVATAGTNVITAAASMLVVSVRLRRVLQSI